MEWFFNILDKIIQNQVIHAIFHNLSWVDWVTAAFLLIGFIYGLKQGFFRCLAVSFETCLVIFIVFSLEKKFAIVIANSLSYLKESQTRPFSYLLLLILVSLGTMFIDGKIKSTFHTKLAGAIKYTGGAIFGVILLLLFWSLGSKFLMLLPVERLHRPFSGGGSKTGEFVLSAAPSVYKFMKNPFGGGEKKAEK